MGAFITDPAAPRGASAISLHSNDRASVKSRPNSGMSLTKNKKVSPEGQNGRGSRASNRKVQPTQERRDSVMSDTASDVTLQRYDPNIKELEEEEEADYSSSDDE